MVQPTAHACGRLILLAIICVCISGATPLNADDGPGRLVAPDLDAYIDPTAKGGRCFAGNLLESEGRLPGLDATDLAFGEYVASFRLRVSHTVDQHIARMIFKVTATQRDEVIAECSFNIVHFETPNTYQDITLPLTIRRKGTVTFGVSYQWSDMKSGKRPYPKAALPDQPNQSFDKVDEFELDVPLSKLPWHVALSGIRISPVHEVTLNDIESNKIRYMPGEDATISGFVTNYSSSTRTVTVATDLVRDMATSRDAGSTKVVVAGRSRVPFSITTTLTDDRWGREARVRILEGDTELDHDSVYFTVHDNPWAVAIGAYGLQLAYYRAGGESYKNCEPMARGIKRSYGNMVEFVFWAEDDFGDLTPTGETYWCGQLRHMGGAESTRRLVKAFSDAGIASSFYARIKVSAGKEGYELYRKHPNWLRPGFYDVSHLDRWDRSKDLTSWPRAAVRGDTAEPYRHHAQEIIRSAKDFGWAAIRYDSAMETKELDGVAYPVAKYFPEVKSIVNNELPGFQWGYNDALHRRDLSKEPELLGLFKTLCNGGGMIMDEYNNHAFQSRWTYDRYASRHRHIQKMVHENGGHYTLCPFDLDWVNDQVYQAILPLVARGHHAWDPHKGQVPYSNYHEFSTRYAGAIWDPKAITLPDAQQRIKLGSVADKLFHPFEYTYLRPRGNGRSDIIMHMVNQPPERAASYNDNRVNQPITDIATQIAIPNGYAVQGVYSASAEPSLHQQGLDFQTDGGTVSFTVPKVRFWTMVVVQLERQGGQQ